MRKSFWIAMAALLVASSAWAGPLYVDDHTGNPIYPPYSAEAVYNWGQGDSFAPRELLPPACDAADTLCKVKRVQELKPYWGREMTRLFSMIDDGLSKDARNGTIRGQAMQEMHKTRERAIETRRYAFMLEKERRLSVAKLTKQCGGDLPAWAEKLSIVMPPQLSESEKRMIHCYDTSISLFILNLRARSMCGNILGDFANVAKRYGECRKLPDFCQQNGLPASYADCAKLLDSF